MRIIAASNYEKGISDGYILAPNDKNHTTDYPFLLMLCAVSSIPITAFRRGPA